MDFTTLKGLSIPEGVVTKISRDDGIVLWQLSTSRLPKEYQEVEWLRVNKNEGAYIDLGFSFDTKARIYMSQWIFSTAYTTYPFGATENSGKLRCCLSSPYSNGATLYGSTGTGYISCGTSLVTIDDLSGCKNEFYINIEKENLFIENITFSIKSNILHNQGEYTMTNNLYLFAQNYNGSPRYGNIRQIGYFKYYDKNDILICDLIPCYQKLGNIPGMYDLVSGKFFTNSGSGSFIIGTKIEDGNNSDVNFEFVDLISTAIDDDGSIYNNVGYKDGYRWSSSGGGEVSHADGRISGWLPYEYGSTYRIENFYLQAGYVAGAYIVYKKTDGSITTQSTGYETPTSGFVVDIEADTAMFVANLTNVTHFKVSGYKGAETPIIAKMEIVK